MLRTSLTLGFIVVCEVVVFAGQTVDKMLSFDGLTRTYTVYVPDSYNGDEQWPLVMNFHGTDGNSDSIAEISQMNPVADTEQFLVAYPKSASNRWNTQQLATRADDLGFVDALLERLSLDYRVDSSRVYATGESNGSSMTFLVGHELANRFAAIAPVNGPIPAKGPAGEIGPFDPTAAPTSSRAVPLMYFAGTADFLVKYDGGISPLTNDTYPPTAEIVNAWVVNNGCDADATITSLPDLDTTDRSTVEVHGYSGCDTYTSADGLSEVAAEVLHYKIIGGNHQWPGGRSPPPLDNPLVAPRNDDISASQEMWDFFSRHTLPFRGTNTNCDFTADVRCNLADLDTLTSAIAASTTESQFDLNGDTRVNVGDLSEWLSIAATENGFSEPYLLGDADLDGTIGASDLNRVGLNWRGSSNKWSDGDFNADGMVDAGDLNTLALNWRQSIGAATATAAVPEPGNAWMVMLAAALMIRRTRDEWVRNGTTNE